VQVHRNFDIVKKLREMAEAQPNQMLEEAWLQQGSHTE
jgi:hypothetical protein